MGRCGAPRIASHAAFCGIGLQMLYLAGKHWFNTGDHMPRVDAIRSEVQRLIRAVPFRKFVLNLENGDRATVEHQENIAFDPEPEGADDFYVISGKFRLFSTFGAVANVALVDREGAAA